MLLHICNNFVSSKVHVNLLNAFANKSEKFKQHVFVPVRKKSDIGKNQKLIENVTWQYSKCQGPVIKYFPMLKILSTLIFLLWGFARLRGVQDTRILAHTLWSDGCVAYFFYLLTGCPYNVVVRNTDLNWFLPKLPHYRWLIRKIVYHADSLIFVSPSYQKRMAEKYPLILASARHVSVIPNGVEEFWIKNSIRVNVRREQCICFVGRFDKNKNLGVIFRSVELARKSLPELRLVLVGGTGQEFLECANIVEIPDWVDVRGQITDKEVIRTIYASSAVFLLPSFQETFGLVYIEALSQGCPFIYTKNEGVDGFFTDKEFAVGVDPRDNEQIAEAIKNLMFNFSQGIAMSIVLNELEKFDWGNVASSYSKVIFNKQ
jgi:glycosyltransferase involved in cell wall biosynthesis